MDDVMKTSPLAKLAPLVLRLGLAAVLVHSGWNQISPAFGGETGETVAADAQGVAVAANWSSVIGGGQCLVGGLLLIGFFTRLVSLAVVGGVGYCAYTAMTAVDGESLSAAAQAMDAQGSALWLLAAACASLVVSGAGCLGLDCRGKAKLPKNDALTT
jgi:uncharacterized membrane protein YphA (DoxX/SURF4 family)